MSKKIWPGNAISVILLPSGASGQEILEVAKFWTAQKLLSRAIWVQPENITKFDNKPPVVSGLIFGLDEQQEIKQISIDLFEELAREQIKIVRFVVIRYLKEDHLFDQLQDSHADLLAEYLNNSIPLESSKLGTTVEKIRFNKINLVVAPTELQHGFKKEIFEEGWDINVIASPEDRTNPWSGDAFVREDNRFVNFALMHLATVAGLWNGLPIGTFETFLRETSVPGMVWIPRIFVSVIMTDGLTRRVSANILQELLDVDSSTIDANVSLASGTYQIPENQIKEYVDLMTKLTLEFDENLLQYFRPAELDDPAKVRWYELEQIKSYLKFSKDKISAIPKWMWLWLRRKFGQILTKKFQGDEGQAVVGIADESSYDFRDRILLDQMNKISTISEEAKKALISPISLNSTRAPNEIWHKIRQLVFGMLDGGDLSKFGILPKDNGVPVFAKVNDVIQDPNFIQKISDDSERAEIELNWQNLENATSIRNEISSEIITMKREFDDLLEKAINIDSDINVIKNPKQIEINGDISKKNKDKKVLSLFSFNRRLKEVAIRGKDNNDSEASEEEKKIHSEDFEQTEDIQEESSINYDDDSNVEDKANNDLDFNQSFEEDEAKVKFLTQEKNGFIDESSKIQDQITQANQTLHELNSWINLHERSYFWKLIASMNSNLFQAKGDLNKFESDVNNLILPEPGQLIELRKNFHRSLMFSLTLLTAILATILVAYYFWNDLLLLPWTPSYQQLAITFPILYISVIFSSLTFYYRGWSKFQRDVVISLHKMQTASASSVHCRQEVVRLENLYLQTKDWLEIIARAVHNPWQINEKWLTSDAKSFQDYSLPFALHIAQAYEGHSGKIENLKNSTKQKMLVKGWRSEAFSNLIQGIQRKMNFSDLQFDVDRLDKDNPDAPNNSRNIMKKYMGDFDVLNHVAKIKMKHLFKIIQSDTLQENKPPVLHERINPLELFLADSMELDLDVKELDWDSFLKETIKSDQSPQTPISVYPLSVNGRISGHHENVKTYFILPKRIEDNYKKDLDYASIKGFTEESDRSLDLVVRVDIVGPIPPADILVWNSQTTDSRVQSLINSPDHDPNDRSGI